MEKIDFKSNMVNMNSKCDEVKTIAHSLQEKFIKLEQSLERKFETWKLEAISKIASINSDDIELEARCKEIQAQTIQIDLLNHSH